MSQEKKIAGLPVMFGKNTIEVAVGKNPEALENESAEGMGGGESGRPEYASFKADTDGAKGVKGSAYKTTGYVAKAE